MLGLIFSCSGCGGAPETEAFPLCRACATSLRPAPRLAPDECIDSYTAIYLLVEPGYSVIRGWKNHGGPLLDRRILKLDPELVNRLPGDAVVPIPQRNSRAWRLGRSPSEVIARWLSKSLEIPLLRMLEIAPEAQKNTRQAKLDLQGRLKSQLGFRLIRDFQPAEKILLVDDFMTSGHTLRSAARILRQAGVRTVHAFALGVRPSSSDSAEPSKTRPTSASAAST